MSRFEHLEFEGDREERSPQQRPAASARDEAHYLEVARTAFENGYFEQGLRFYSRVLEFSPHNTVAWAGQARMLIELGEFREACLWADKALERFPNDAELLAAKAVALARGGDVQAAMAFSDASVEERGDAPYVWLARADVLLARREKLAEFCFDKAAALAPGDWFVAWLAGRIRLFYEQFALALKCFQQALELNTAHFRLWLELGWAQQGLGLLGPAHNSFSRARELNPDCPDVLRALSDWKKAGATERVRGWWHRVFSRGRNLPPPHRGRHPG